MTQQVKSELLCTASKDVEKFEDEDLEDELTAKERADAIAQFSDGRTIPNSVR